MHREGRRAHLLAVWSVVVLLFGFGSVAEADLTKGQAKLLSGDYAEAKKELRSATGAETLPAKLALVRVEMATGNWAEAEKGARALVANRNVALSADAKVALAEVLRVRGRYAEAEKLTAAVVASNTKHLRARWLRGVLLVDLGKTAEAKVEFDWFADQWDAGAIDASRPGDMFYLGEATRRIGEFQFANDVFRDVIDRSPNHLEANLRWGQMFLEKYSAGNAAESFNEVLKINPNHPLAHAGAARARLDGSYDIAGAIGHIALALAVDKAHIPSLLVRASIEIDQNKWEAAKATLAEVFKVNPMSFEGRSMLATIHWLRDETADYERERTKVLTANPKFAAFYHIVARSAVREHRYDVAIELEKAAVKINGDYYEAMQAIGTGYLRVGKEKEGLEWLRKAWKGDEYNTRTFNTLELFDEHVPRNYSFSRSKSFKIRYHNDEKEVLSRYLTPMLERAYADMVKRYKFTPKTPLVVELFSDPSHFSVRTVGLPNLGALGVCFGQVVTAISPSVGDLNYSMVLWHELSHVFAIQISKSRVPRWYTEGLSEYETILARPEWRRENDADVWAAMQDGDLPSVAELNYGFMNPSMKKVVVAYHLSSLTIEYIARNFGFDKVVEGLHLFGKGMETPEVVTKITGKSIAAFDKEFRAYLNVRLRPYQGTLHIPDSGYDDLKKLEANAAAKPKDAVSFADLALGHFYDGDAEKAEAAAAKALTLEKTNKIALYVQAEVSARKGQSDVAQKSYEDLIRAGGDSFDVRSRLAMLATRKGDTASAEKHLCTSKQLDPERSYPYQALSELYAKSGRQEEALRELETFVMIEQMQYSPVKRLITEYNKLGRWQKVVDYGRLALDINPFDVDLLLVIAKANLEVGDAASALYHYESALVVEPPLRRPAVAHIGRAKALAATGKKSAAKVAIKKALALEPENAEALELKQKF